MTIFMKRMMLATMFMCAAGAVSANGLTGLWLSGDAGDYLAGGQTISISSPAYSFSLIKTKPNNAVIINTNTTTATIANPENWALSFGPPSGSTLQVGKYDKATRFPFESPTGPGLDVSGNHVGCNASSGFFVVREYVTASDGTVSSFAADFVQHCENRPPKLSGAVRYDSAIPLNIGTPVAMAPSMQQVDGGAAVTLDGSDSIATFGNTVSSYTWTQVSGPSVTLSNASSAVATFTAPTLATTQTLVFQLTVVDSAGQSDTVSESVTVNGSKAAKTELDLVESASNHFLFGNTLTLTPDDATFSVSGDQHHVSISVTNQRGWSLDFAAPKGDILTPGAYKVGAIYPLQTPSEAGMRVWGNSQACQTVGGLFAIKEISFDPTGNIAVLAIDFQEYCDGASNKLVGALRYNSAVATNSTAPFALTGFNQSVSPGSAVTLDGSSSVASGSNSLVSYQWVELSGPPITLSQANSAIAQFTAPTVAAKQTAVFQLTVTDSRGQTSSGTESVTIVSPNGPVSELYYVSDANDWTGHGATSTVTANDASFSATGDANHINITLNQGQSWSLDFAAPDGRKLAPGATFPYATRFPFQSSGIPGMDVSGNGAGCNTLTGFFVIHDLGFNADGSVSTFAADFQQHCEGGSAKLAGAIRFNSTIPAISSTPYALTATNVVTYAGLSETLDGTQSIAQGNATLVSYQWAQTSGPSVSLTNANTASASFIVPSWSGDQTLTFTLTVKDSNGAVGISTINVAVKGVVSTQNLFSFHSDTGDYVGNGTSQDITEGGGAFTLTGDAGHVHIQIGDLNKAGDGNQWTFDFAGHWGLGMDVGTAYWGSVAYPYPALTTGAPGLYVTGQGRGCSNANGFFYVSELDVDTNGKVTGFAANFDQYCGNINQGLHGTILYNVYPYTITATPSGPKTALTLNADVRVASADQGKQGQIYVAAQAYGNLYMNNVIGWIPADGKNYPPYLSGPLTHQLFTPIYNLDVSRIPSLIVYIGYGYSFDEMLASKRFRAVYSY